MTYFSGFSLIFVLATLPILFNSCNSASADADSNKYLGPDKLILSGKHQLPEVWFDGRAEVNKYTLLQNRYKDVHPGEAVLIQVTEPFNTVKQVKADQPDTKGNASVLKTNLIERFRTGVYDYSMMTSVFTSTDFPFQTMKVTISSQDWCGQSFSQLNLINEKLEVQQFSYFESEADNTRTLDNELLEDELWNLLRISPSLIPQGTVDMIPSLKIQRLLHLPSASIPATLTVHEANNLRELRLEMPSIKRSKSIFFEPDPPYSIINWTDSYPSLFDEQERTSKTTLLSSQRTKYWELNSLDDG